MMRKWLRYEFWRPWLRHDHADDEEEADAGLPPHMMWWPPYVTIEREYVA